jgi:hypothetical protein
MKNPSDLKKRFGEQRSQAAEEALSAYRTAERTHIRRMLARLLPEGLQITDDQHQQVFGDVLRVSRKMVINLPKFAIERRRTQRQISKNLSDYRDGVFILLEETIFKDEMIFEVIQKQLDTIDPDALSHINKISESLKHDAQLADPIGYYAEHECDEYYLETLPLEKKISGFQHDLASFLALLHFAISRAETTPHRCAAHRRGRPAKQQYIKQFKIWPNPSRSMLILTCLRPTNQNHLPRSSALPKRPLDRRCWQSTENVR